MEAVDNKINKIIKRNLKSFSRKEQRAELFRRNKIFLSQFDLFSKKVGKDFFKVKNIAEEKLSEESQDNKLLNLDYPKVKKKFVPFFFNDEEDITQEFSSSGIDPDKYDLYLDSTYDESDPFTEIFNLELVTFSDPTDKEITIQDRLAVLHGYKDLWKAFCYGWHINPEWDGNFDHLSRFQRPFIEIGYDKSGKSQSISIRINSWTTLEDLRKKWHEVIKIQENIFHKEKESFIFSRNLFWYDLRQSGLTYREIAKIWVKKYPEKIDYFIATKYLKENKEILGDISPIDLLKRIRSNNPRFKDESESFEQFKREYIFGETVFGRKISSPFSDLIRMSIKNFEKKINRLDKF